MIGQNLLKLCISDLIVVSSKPLDEPSVNMDKLVTEDIEQAREQPHTEHNIFQVKDKQETMDVDSIEADKEYIDQDRGSSLTSENDTNSTLSGGEVNLAFIPETSPRGHSRKPSSVLSDISINKVSFSLCIISSCFLLLFIVQTFNLNIIILSIFMSINMYVKIVKNFIYNLCLFNSLMHFDIF